MNHGESGRQISTISSYSNCILSYLFRILLENVPPQPADALAPLWPPPVLPATIPCPDGRIVLARSRFTVCGPDREGRSVMWINGGLTREEDESRLIRTSCLMFLSCHADLHTLVRIF